MTKREPRQVHGDDLLYRFFRDLFRAKPDQATALASRLIESTAIWLPLSAFHVLPVVLPWVVRDPTCRGSAANGEPDQWSAPNADGYLRDDNSLVKSIPRSWSVTGPHGAHLTGARMGKEFVASHVWRVVHHQDLASRLPLLNTFVPNLTWLPRQVAKLSDQEGSPLQQTLQRMSWAIYRTAPVAPHLAAVVSQAWSLIPEPDDEIAVDPARMNWFVPADRSLRLRAAQLRLVSDALRAQRDGQPPSGKVITTRYTQGISELTPSTCTSLLSFLDHFTDV